MKKLGSLFFYLEQERGDKGAKRCSSRVLLNNCFYVDEGKGVIKWAKSCSRLLWLVPFRD